MICQRSHPAAESLVSVDSSLNLALFPNFGISHGSHIVTGILNRCLAPTLVVHAVEPNGEAADLGGGRRTTGTERAPGTAGSRANRSHFTASFE
jgi:hypothetical protein